MIKVVGALGELVKGLSKDLEEVKEEEKSVSTEIDSTDDVIRRNAVSTSIRSIDRRLTRAENNINRIQRAFEKTSREINRYGNYKEGRDEYVKIEPKDDLHKRHVDKPQNTNTDNSIRGATNLLSGILGSAAGLAGAALYTALGKTLKTIPWRAFGLAAGGVGLVAGLSYMIGRELYEGNWAKKNKDELDKIRKRIDKIDVRTRKGQRELDEEKKNIRDNMQRPGASQNTKESQDALKSAAEKYRKSNKPVQADTLTLEAELRRIRDTSLPPQQRHMEVLNVLSKYPNFRIESLPTGLVGMVDRARSWEKRNTRKGTETFGPPAPKKMDLKAGRMNLGAAGLSGTVGPGDWTKQFAGSSGMKMHKTAMRFSETPQTFADKRMRADFLSFGALPRGFEHVAGHRGILGKPSAVAASGAMPFGGGMMGGSSGGTPSYNIPSSTTSGGSSKSSGVYKTPVNPTKFTGSKKDAFKKMYDAGVKAGMTDTQAKAMASLTMLESGWGKSRMAREHNNPFGQTITPAMIGKNGIVGGTRGADGQLHATFDSLESAVKYHMKHKRWSKVYAATKDSTNPEDIIEGLRARGYNSVDGSWKGKILSIEKGYSNSVAVKNTVELKKILDKEKAVKKDADQGAKLIAAEEIAIEKANKATKPSFFGNYDSDSMKFGNIKGPQKLGESVLDKNVPVPVGGLSENATAQNMRKGRWNRKGGNPYAQKGDVVSFRTAYGHRIHVNKDAARAYEGMFKDLKEAGYPITRVGSFNIRSKRGGKSFSQHSYGNAVDINDTIKFSSEQKRWMRENPGKYDEILGRWGMVSRGGGMDWDEQHIEYGGSLPNSTLKRLMKKGPDTIFGDNEITMSSSNEIDTRSKQELARDGKLNFATGQHINQGFTPSLSRVKGNKGPPVRPKKIEESGFKQPSMETAGEAPKAAPTVQGTFVGKPSTMPSKPSFSFTPKEMEAAATTGASVKMTGQDQAPPGFDGTGKDDGSPAIKEQIDTVTKERKKEQSDGGGNRHGPYTPEGAFPRAGDQGMAQAGKCWV